MTPEEIRVEVHRVIRGNAGFPAIGFPREPQAIDTVITWSRMFTSTAGVTTELQRTLFIRKLAIDIVRRERELYRDGKRATRCVRTTAQKSRTCFHQISGAISPHADALKPPW